jgi:photosystem II stability/assembly factor-like uncharacterized protein
MTDQELEQRLRNWYRAEIGETEVAPLSLRRDIAAIPRTLPRRAQWFARRRGPTLLAAALTVVGLAAAGSGILRLTSPVPSETAPSLHPVVEVSPTAEAVAPSPTPDDALPATAGMINGAGSILLASETVGWLSTANSIYRTRDMGRTWTEARPAGWSEFTRVRFVDTDTAYVTSAIVGSKGGPLTIAATHDGGTSWVEGTIDAPAGMANMGFSFRTPDDGFATFFTQDGKDVQVFETTNGGRTWTGPVHSSAPRMLYLFKDELSGDPASGSHAIVLTNSLSPGRPFDNNVYFSLDGGVTWAKRPFPVSHRAPAAAMKGASVWADGSSRIVLSMAVWDDVQVYTSDDDGQSWQFVRDLGRDVGNAQFLSATEWIFASGSSVVSTEDGGVTWRTTEGSSRIFPYDVSFSSPDRGWALLACYDYPAEGIGTYCKAPQPGVRDGTVVFLATTDGGQTWTRIGG